MVLMQRYSPVILRVYLRHHGVLSCEGEHDLYPVYRFTDLVYRNLRGHSEDEDTLHSTGSLALRVCMRTYKLFYVANTEETMWRTTSKEESDKATRNLEAHNSRKKKWLPSLPSQTYSEWKPEARPKPEASTEST